MTEEESVQPEQNEGAGQPEDTEALKKALAEAKAQADGNLAGWQRAQADFINFKRRSEQDKDEGNRAAKAEIILNLLPVLDDLERGLGGIPREVAKDRWVDGIKLIERKCKNLLEIQGLTPIKALGQPFDPNFHEAVKQDKGKEGIVVGEVQKGYMLKDRVLRPSKVIVGNGKKTDESDAPAEQQREENDACQKQ